MIDIRLDNIAGHEVDDLLKASDEYMERLYPSESNHLIYLDQLLNPANVFIGAYFKDNIVGCGAIVLNPESLEYGEVKRLYVDESYRGHKIATKIMNKLEELAKGSGILGLRLETGIYQPEAISLYQKLGYQNILPFGEYEEDLLSVYMGKTF
jgi:putative acetyltransferase